MKIETGDLVLDHGSKEIALVISVIRESSGYIEVKFLHDGKHTQLHEKYLSVLKKRGSHERR